MSVQRRQYALLDIDLHTNYYCSFFFQAFLSWDKKKNLCLDRSHVIDLYNYPILETVLLKAQKKQTFNETLQNAQNFVKQAEK